MPDAINLASRRNLITFGRIAGPHGLRGALRVRPENPDPSNLGLLKRLFVEQGNSVTEHRILAVSTAGAGSLKIELEGIDTVEQAQALHGLNVYIDATDLPAPGPSEFYYFQILGMRVETSSGRTLGRIEEVFFNGAHDVWVVKDADREFLIPVIEDVVRRIDLDSHRAIVEPIPGLLD